MLASVNCQDVIDWLERELKPNHFKDYAPNGLQVSGRQNISQIVSGVSVSQALIQAAINCQADMLLVHHGCFWQGEKRTLVSHQRERMAMLLAHDINLVAYHLPLDAHARWGNNVCLAKLLNIDVQGLMPGHDPALGRYGQLATPQSPKDFAKWITQQLKRQPLHIAGQSAMIQSVGLSTGADQDGILQAADMGLDAFISGEVSERTTYLARELGVHYFAAGHHATERYGVQALGAALAEKFNIKHTYIEIDNPV
ncbi:Nif3-like dinuclear metal center hexameric protein [Gammaproteobacteria bacterium]|nr:Nif3-like dinuclear metal center hexameric protein [Gammaproteobacteria bacterium]